MSSFYISCCFYFCYVTSRSQDSNKISVLSELDSENPILDSPRVSLKTTLFQGHQSFLSHSEILSLFTERTTELPMP